MSTSEEVVRSLEEEEEEETENIEQKDQEHRQLKRYKTSIVYVQPQAFPDLRTCFDRQSLIQHHDFFRALLQGSFQEAQQTTITLNPVCLMDNIFLQKPLQVYVEEIQRAAWSYVWTLLQHLPQPLETFSVPLLPSILSTVKQYLCYIGLEKESSWLEQKHMSPKGIHHILQGTAWTVVDFLVLLALYHPEPNQGLSEDFLKLLETLSPSDAYLAHGPAFWSWDNTAQLSYTEDLPWALTLYCWTVPLRFQPSLWSHVIQRCDPTFTTAWEKRFSHMTQGWLDAQAGFPWSDHIIVAGGAVYLCTSEETLALRQPDTDVDLWIFGDFQRRTKELQNLLEYFQKRSQNTVYFVQQVSVITVVIPGLELYLQIIMTEVQNPLAVISRFDLDYVKAFYAPCYGLCVTPEAQRAWRTRTCYNFRPDMKALRIHKLQQRGFTLDPRYLTPTQHKLFTQTQEEQKQEITTNLWNNKCYRYYYPSTTASRENTHLILQALFSYVSNFPIHVTSTITEELLHRPPFGSTSFLNYDTLVPVPVIPIPTRKAATWKKDRYGNYTLSLRHLFEIHSWTEAFMFKEHPHFVSKFLSIILKLTKQHPLYTPLEQLENNLCQQLSIPLEDKALLNTYVLHYRHESHSIHLSIRDSTRFFYSDAEIPLSSKQAVKLLRKKDGCLIRGTFFSSHAWTNSLSRPHRFGVTFIAEKIVIHPLTQTLVVE